MELRLNESDREAMVAFLRDLIRIPSTSTNESKVVERTAAEMRRLGFHGVFIDPVGSVLGQIGEGSGPRLLYDSHTDTVGIGARSSWSYDPYEGKMENGYIYGRGAVDNKGALAAMVYGARLLLEAGVKLRGTLYVSGMVQEEDCDGFAAGEFCQRCRPNYVVLGEPSGLQVSRGQKGRIGASIMVHGRASHGSAPERGVNAIYLMAPVLDSIQKLAPMLREDTFLGKGSLAVTRIESTAGSLNAVPDTCTIYIDRRLTAGESEQEAMAQLESIARNAGGTKPAEVKILEYREKSHTGYDCRRKLSYPAWALPEEHYLVQTLVEAAASVLGHRPAITRWDFSTDGAVTMGEMGIPTVGFGPGAEADAHTTDDKVAIADLVTAAAVYARLAADILK